MPQTTNCPKCGAQIPDNAPAAICPTCLLRAGLEAPGDSAETTANPSSFVPPRAERLAPHFPQLEITELLGHGGMGAVYKAHQTKLDRVVALKIMRPESASESLFAQRFNREARTLARLNHPNIVTVHDFGEVTFTETVNEDSADEDAAPGKLYYFLMEFVDGQNLRQIMDDGDLQPRRAMAIIPQICKALQYAHDKGVVHRDIKPENVLLDQRGQVKIADFGLAKLASGSEQDVNLTGTYQVMGTPRYMAPEQMEGSRDVDHRADIYSLGVVFYELLTGQTPAGHFDPPSQKVDIDVRLDEVVLRSLAREPDRRYQRASDVGTDVDSIAHDTPVGRDADKSPTETAAEAPSFEAANRGIVPLMFSRKAILAACWAPLILGVPLAFAPDRSHAAGPLWPMPWQWPLIFSIGPLGIAAPFATTILGWLALNDLHHSNGRLRGYGLACFCALLYPLLVLDLGILTICGGIMQWFSPNRFLISWPNLSWAIAISLPLAIALDVLIARRVWRATARAGSDNRIMGRATSRTGSTDVAGTANQKCPKLAIDSSHPPLTQLQFSVPLDRDLDVRIAFHFEGLGYRCVSRNSDCQIFTRGRKWAGLWSTEMRAIYTVLTVRTLCDEQLGCLVNCSWQLRMLGAMYTRKEVARIEQEGRDLAAVLGGSLTVAPERDNPPESRGSVARTLLQLAVLVGILVGGSWLIYVAMTSGFDPRLIGPDAAESQSR